MYFNTPLNLPLIIYENTIITKELCLFLVIKRMHATLCIVIVSLSYYFLANTTEEI